MVSMGSNNAADVLLVEDNQADVRLIQEAFRKSSIIGSLNVVSDGVQAVDYLNQRNGFDDVKRPDLIILDLNLPKKNGREVLTEIKTDASLRCIPVVILTVSRAPQDILASYDSHANCYVTKPADFDDFSEVVRAIENYWFEIVKLPPKNSFQEI